jgi:phosphoadenosine phosphosulfate reductase
MALRENTLFGIADKVKDSIQLLQDLEPDEGYYLAFSGGKDSICIKRIADMAGVKYDAHYSVTTIDPPELVQYIRKHHPNVAFVHPERPMLKMFVKHGFPTRLSRWCCADYKENGGAGRKVITGIRAAESAKRAGRRAVETCYKDSSKMYINAIIRWTDDEVWEFIREQNLPYCKLYDEGWKRIGCLMCPMANGEARNRERDTYPRYEAAFRKAFRDLHDRRSAEGKDGVKRWKDGDEMFDWWMDDNRTSEDSDQTVLFE